MSPDLEKQLITLVESARTAGANAVDFIQQHAPDLAEQLLKYKMVGWTFGFVACLVAVVVLAFVLRKLKAAANESKWVDLDFFAFGMVMCALLMAVPTGFAIKNAMHITRALVAPKVVLIETVYEITQRK